MINYYDNFQIQSDDGYGRYVVKNGDSLYLIAKEYGTTPETLMSINGLSSTMIYPNQILLVPMKNNSQDFIYITRNKDTLKTISKKTGYSLRDLLDTNATSLEFVPNQKLNLPRIERDYHVVKEGDSIQSIIDEYSTNVENLVKLNASSILTPGVRIRVK